jgi:hypothetical protein
VLEEGEKALPDREQKLLDRICDAYYLPAWCSIADYERLMQESGMQVPRGDFAVDGCQCSAWRITMYISAAVACHAAFLRQLCAALISMQCLCGNAGHQDRGLVQRGVALLASRHPVGLLCEGRQRAAAGRLDHHQGAAATPECT